MGRKGVKIAYDIRLKYAKLCFEGKLGLSTAAHELGIDPSTMAMWVALYREQGELVFLDTGRNQVYSDELRQQAVSRYLRGEGNLKTVSAKYGLSWMYTAGWQSAIHCREYPKSRIHLREAK